MSNAQQYELASTDEMDKRQQNAQDFFAKVYAPDEQPWFVSDETALYDIDMGDEEELRQRIERHYGLRVTPEQFALPLWQFLDYLSAHRAAETQLASVGS